MESLVEFQRLARGMVQASLPTSHHSAAISMPPVLVIFMVDKCHWDRIFSEHVLFFLSVSFHQCSTLTYILSLLLPEGKAEGYELSEKAKFFRVPNIYTLLISVPMVTQDLKVQGKNGI